MTANFWTSSQAQRWMFTRAQLLLAREEDLMYSTPEEVGAIGIWCANAVSLLSKRLQLRQRVSATATVFLKRFYAKNSYCATDPCLVIAACVYVASKCEESPVHIRTVVAEATRIWLDMGHRTFPTSSSVLGEMEFFLLEDLEFDLIVHHPYRTLVQVATEMGHITRASDSGSKRKEADTNISRPGSGGTTGAKRKRSVDEGRNKQQLQSETDAELGVGTGEASSSLDTSDEPRFSEFNDAALQMAWFVLNDTYRSDIPLLYPPHLIAIAAIFLALVLHPPACKKMEVSCETMQQARAKWEEATLSHEATRFANSQVAASEPSKASPATLSTPAGATHGPAASGVSSTLLAQTPAISASAAHLLTSKPPAPPPDALTILATLNVSLPLVAEIVQEMLSSYELWHRVGSTSGAAATEEDGEPAAQRPTEDMVGDGAGMLDRLKRMREARRKDIQARGKRN